MRRRDMTAVLKARDAMLEAAQAYLDARKLWLKETERLYRMLVALKDPTLRKDLAEIKEMLDLIRPKRKPSHKPRHRRRGEAL